MKYLYPYECEKRRLSTPSELQAAIDGNRREGRRTSYGGYPELMRRSPGPPMPPQMSPLGHLRPQMNGNGHVSHLALHPALAQPPLAGEIQLDGADRYTYVHSWMHVSPTDADNIPL